MNNDRFLAALFAVIGVAGLAIALAVALGLFR